MKFNLPNGGSLSPQQKKGLMALALVAGISFLLFVARPHKMGMMAFAGLLLTQSVMGAAFCVGSVIAIRLLFGAPGKPGLVRKAADWLSKARHTPEPQHQPKAA